MAENVSPTMCVFCFDARMSSCFTSGIADDFAEMTHRANPQKVLLCINYFHILGLLNSPVLCLLHIPTLCFILENIYLFLSLNSIGSLVSGSLNFAGRQFSHTFFTVPSQETSQHKKLKKKKQKRPLILFKKCVFIVIFWFFTGGKTSSTDLSFHGVFSHAL